jgi:hypothetical protein
MSLPKSLHHSPSRPALERGARWAGGGRRYEGAARREERPFFYGVLTKKGGAFVLRALAESSCRRNASGRFFRWQPSVHVRAP